MLTALGYLALALLAAGFIVGGKALLSVVARGLSLWERKIAVLEAARRSPAVPVAIPSDLYRRITKWGTPEAQDDERKILLDLYQEFQGEPDPWASVRAHLPVEPDDRWVDTISEGGLVH